MQPQIDLFEKNEQVKQIERVRGRLMPTLLEFTRNVYKLGGGFNMNTLFQYFFSCGVHCSPGSPSRILRLAKEEKLLDYEVLSRSKSLYRIKWVK